MENKVTMELNDYIDMIDKINSYKRIIENMDFNYDSMCAYIKEEIGESNKYHIENVIKDKLNLDERLNKKLKNYHYGNIANDFIKTGITFELVEKLTDSVIIEHLLDKENKQWK